MYVSFSLYIYIYIYIYIYMYIYIFIYIYLFIYIYRLNTLPFRSSSKTPHSPSFMLFLCISHTIQLTPQQQSAEPRNSASAEAPARGQKAKRGIEGVDPTAAGIERFFSLKCPRREKSSECPSSKFVRTSLSILHRNKIVFHFSSTGWALFE